MKSTRFLFFYMLVASSVILSAQTIMPESKDIKEAEILKKKYTRDKIVMQSDETVIEFEKPKSSDLRKISSSVVASETTNQVVLAINDGQSYSGVIYYNPQIELKEVRAASKKGSFMSVNTTRTNYKNNGIFHDDAKLCYYSIPINTRGSVKRVLIERRYLDTKYLTSVEFHESLPVLQRKLSFIVPDWLDVELKEMNFDGYHVVKEKTRNEKEKTTTYVYKIDSLEAYRNEDNAPRMIANYPHIVVITKSVTTDNGEKIPVIGNTDDLYNWYHSLVLAIGNDPAILKPQVSKLTEGLTEDFEKVKAIFYYVQDNIRYIAFENGIMGFKPDAAQNVYSKKYGDCKGMANLLCEMLKIAGYDARLTWLGTRGIPYDYSIPSIAVDNHMICTLFLNGKRYFLDATEKYITIDDYADRIQGRQVMIEDGDKYILDYIPVFTHERNMEKSTVTLQISGERLTGKCVDMVDGEGKTSFLQSYSMIKTNERENALQNYLTDHDKNIAVSNVKFSDLNKREGIINVEYDIVIDHAITTLEDELYISVDKDRSLSGFDFDSLRTNPYMLPYKINLLTDISLTIPEGYKVEYMPDSINTTVAGFTFQLSYKQEGNKILYHKHIYSDEVEIKTNDFKAWNAVIKKLNVFYKDQIILKKK